MLREREIDREIFYNLLVHEVICIFQDLYIFFFLKPCMLPACCFRQRTCMAQGIVNRVLNEIWTHSCLQFNGFQFVMGLYGGHCSYFLWVCFTPLHLWYLIRFLLCVCWGDFEFHLQLLILCLGECLSWDILASTEALNTRAILK